MEWLKFEKATLDKPEVFQIAADLGIDPDAVVGKLLRVWSWFDSQSVDGNAPVTVKALLDRYAGVTGFCESMKKAGWMVENDGEILLPNYDRHTGKTAKARALGAVRTSNSRASAVCNAPTVTKTLQERYQKRKEKNRSDKSTSLSTDTYADKIYAEYPLKVGKSAAIKAILKIKDLAWPMERILGAVKTYAECVSRWPDEDKKFIPHPATWFNQGRYQDDPATWQKGKAPQNPKPPKPELAEPDNWQARWIAHPSGLSPAIAEKSWSEHNRSTKEAIIRILEGEL